MYNTEKDRIVYPILSIEDVPVISNVEGYAVVLLEEVRLKDADDVGPGYGVLNTTTGVLEFTTPVLPEALMAATAISTQRQQLENPQADFLDEFEEEEDEDVIVLN